MSDDSTIAAYDARAEEYGRMAQALHELHDLEAFADLLPAGGRVLDLGCGPGFYAAWLAKAGFQVDAVDASAKMVATAKTQIGVTAWQARFDEINAVAVYDGIWANFSLLHAPRSDLPGHLARLKQAGKKGAILHLGMKLGTGEGTDKLGRFYSYYSKAELAGLLKEAGFTITSSHQGEGPGMAGNIEPWLVLHAHG